MENPVVSIEMLASTISEQSNISTIMEQNIRVHACMLVRNCCTLLKLPQNTSATAQTLLQRFYFVVSVTTIPLFDLVSAAVYLASKLEETHKRLRDVILVMDQLCSPRQNIRYGSTVYFSLMKDYFEFRAGIIQAEISILAKLAFNVHVEHPHGYLFNYISSMNLGNKFAQLALEYLNDSFATIVHCIYQPYLVACGIIHLTSLKTNVALPNDWFQVFDAKEQDLDIIARLVLQLYTIPPTKFEHYNKIALD